MSINIATLAQELAQPQYQEFIPHSPGRIVELLNKPGPETKIISRLIGIGTILDSLGPTQGAQLLDTLESLKASVPTIKWAFYLLEKADLDIGLASTRGAIDQLVAQNIISASDATTIKNLANAPASRAETLFGNNILVTERDVTLAIGTV